MVMGVLLAHKRYPIAKYFCVLLITVGVALFIYKDAKKPDKGLDTDHTFGMGEILLVSQLFLCDQQLIDLRASTSYFMFGGELIKEQLWINGFLIKLWLH